MKLPIATLLLSAGLITASASFAQTGAAAPAGSTGLCKDGSYTSNAEKKGACAGHKGIKDWFGAAPATATSGAAAPVKTTAAAKTAPAATTAPAAGGGPGQVWVNPASKTYHCPGTKYYGKTKQGQYMTEAAAKTAGNHADHAKACS